MRELTTNLEQYIGFVESVFSDKALTTRLPPLHHFPNGCCEYASAYLGVALEAKCPDNSVMVIKAYNRSKDLWHFWVEVDDVVVDITAHQFKGHKTPFVHLVPNPLQPQFPDVESLTPYAARVALHQWSDDFLNSLGKALKMDTII